MDDYDLIEASFLSQYGIRLKTAELQFDEFLNLTGCLMPETPLGRVVAIRSETNADVIKEFTEGQKQIRNDWIKRNALKNERTYVANMDELFAMIKA